MIKFTRLAAYGFLGLLAAATPAMAQPAPASIEFSNFFAIGLIVIGGAYGIGRLAASALEGMARQPEVAGKIQIAMIIAAALIEGFTFFALSLCMG